MRIGCVQNVLFRTAFALSALCAGSPDAGAAANLTDAQALSVDAEGVLRSADGRETNLFGVNYYPCFAYWNTALDRACKDPMETMRMDVAHFRRLGLNCIRIHCFDRQISDVDGHLVDPDGHLAKLDYLIALCASNGIVTVLTPMAHWGGGGDWKGGFCDHYCKDGYEPLVGDERLWTVQTTFLREFAEHRNPHRGNLSYAEDPAIPCFELVNEPAYPEKTPDEKVTRYANALADAMRAGGVKKPLFYNSWRGRASAIQAARVDGVTASIYPTGLNLGSERRGNLLGLIRTQSLFADGESIYRGKARMIYEFDTADTTASCLYPVMAYTFRHSKAQVAAQFEYDPVLIADSNAALHTHYLNLVYTPAKALSLAIAREVFRAFPRGVPELANNGSDVRFGAFRCTAAGDLSEMATETDFLYTNDTATRPPQPESLRRIWGHGSSALVASDGSGAYFLDRLRRGVWRLQVYPNIHCADDPFARRDNVKRAVKKGDVTFRFDVPDLGSAFACTVAPGDWMLEGGRARKASADEIAQMPSVPAYEAPEPVDPLPPVRPVVKNTFIPVREVCSGFASRAYMYRSEPLDLTDGDALYVTVKALKPATTRLEFIVRKLDGSAWSTNLALTTEWQCLRLPLSSFRYRPDKTAVPRDGKTLAPLSECVSCEFVMGRWLFPKTFDQPHGYLVRYVGSVPEPDPAAAEERLVLKAKDGTKVLKTRPVTLSALPNDGWRYKLPADKLSPTATWTELTVPAFLSARTGEEGWWVLPDGRYGTFTRTDGVCDTIAGRMPMPFAGFSSPRGCWMAIFRGLPFDGSFCIRATNGVYTLVSRFKTSGLPRPAEEDGVVDFLPMPKGATYADLARRYRSWKLADKSVRPLAERARERPTLAYTAESIFVRVKHGYKCLNTDEKSKAQWEWQTPTNEPPIKCLISFDQFRDIMRRMKEAGIDKAEVCTVGGTAGGFDGRFPDVLPIPEEFGGERKLREAIAYGQSVGYQMVAHFATTAMLPCSRRWDTNDICRTVGGELLQSGVVAGGRTFRLCPRAYIDKYIGPDWQTFRDLGLRGTHHIDVISCMSPYPCFCPRHPLTRRESAACMREIGRRSQETFGGFGSESGFDWVAPVLDFALYASWFPGIRGRDDSPLVERVVPLWQLVYHGIVVSNPFYATIDAYIDRPQGQTGLSDDPFGRFSYLRDTQDRILKVHEFGGRPVFYYTRYEDVTPLKRAYDDYRKFAYLQYFFMNDHRALTKDVYLTRYSNGHETVANYGAVPFPWKGRKVAAKSIEIFKPTKGTSK